MKSELFNPSWRLNNLYKIRTKASKIVTFKENNVQKILNSRTVNCKRYIILKARQFGVSTNEILKLFDKTIFNTNQETCILAHENKALEKLFGIVKCAYNHLPDPKPEIAKGGGSKYEIYFPELNSRIYVALEVRGGTIHNLHVSELAFFKDMSKLEATLEAVPIDGHVSIETTPHGMNEFYDLWNDNDSGYLNLFFPWYCFDEYRLDTEIQKKDYTDEEIELIAKAKKHNIKVTKEQIAFRRFKKKQSKVFVQEYPEDDNTCFLSSGNPFFDLEIVKKELNKDVIPIKQSGTLTVFENPIPNKKYVAGSDTAEGVGGDYSVMSLYDVKTQRQVLQLRGNWKPSIFAERMNAVLLPYSCQSIPPLLGIERNNHGHAVLLAMENLKYSNLFEDKDERNGWLTNKVSKPIMLNAFKDFLETTPQNIKDKTTLKECLTLVNNDGKIEASQGKHDDCIISNAIAIQMLIKESSSIDYEAAADSFFSI